MGIFISPAKTAECVIIALLFAVALSFCSHKLVGILQSCGYSGKKFEKWTRKKGNLAFERHLLLALLCALSSAVLSLCFSFAGEWAAVIGLAGYAVFFAVYAVADRKIALRCPAKATPRFKRLAVVLFVVYAVAAYVAVTLLNFADHVWGNASFALLKYCALAVLPLCMIPLVCFANLLAKIYEVPHNKKYLKSAKKLLADSHIKVVGITGSYGKTSTKNILSAMLAQKYRVLATPRSHNTPIGIALAANNNSLKEYDVFIAEMGARNVGDIAELCEICPPDYSLITGICPQHLESFGSIENVVKAKGEILAATKEKAFIAADCIGLFPDAPCLIQAPECVSDIEAHCDGTSFTLTLGGKSLRVKTKLLGSHSANNVALAAGAAFELGVSIEQIAKAVEECDFVEHRLQLIEANGVNILDDGYNSNVKGAAAALEVLRSFGGRKIVVTPGLVELGILEREENAQLGAGLKGLDLVILVGDTLVTAVKEGYVAAGGDPEKLVIRADLAGAKEYLASYLKRGDTVLFLNDLPDIY